MHHPTDRITHTTAFVTPVVEHWLEREIAQWVKGLDNVYSHGYYTFLQEIMLKNKTKPNKKLYCLILTVHHLIFFTRVKNLIQLWGWDGVISPLAPSPLPHLVRLRLGYRIEGRVGGVK